ncbi:hypothetical protein B0H14DRAFT_3551143 [Mycena olivaceomarginata]|nr:hypothetical protein B0H14DRAFT_3551143 [Mycena olivaceomarginata]
MRVLQDTQTVRDAKLYVSLLSLQNDLQKIIATKPAYTVSPELKVNIKAYVAPVLLSPKLPAYKGDEPVGLVFGRSKFKKLLSASVQIRRDKKFEMLPPEKHQNLYSLAQAFVNDTKCRINAGLVGRIALMCLAINFATLCTAFINLATTWKGNLVNQLAAIICPAAGHPYIWSLSICHAIWPTNVG